MADLAKLMSSEDVHEFLFRDFHTLCIKTRIGLDKRTAAAWIHVAQVEKLVAVAKMNQSTGVPIYSRGARFDKWANGHAKRKKKGW